MAGRHSVATHLLQYSVDIRINPGLLDHAKHNTTVFYTNVATRTIHAATSPLDKLAIP